MLHQGRDITDLILETPWGTVSSQGLNGMDSVSVSLPLDAGPVSCGGEPAPVGALVWEHRALWVSEVAQGMRDHLAAEG